MLHLILFLLIKEDEVTRSPSPCASRTTPVHWKIHNAVISGVLNLLLVLKWERYSRFLWISSILLVISSSMGHFITDKRDFIGFSWRFQHWITLVSWTVTLWYSWAFLVALWKLMFCLDMRVWTILPCIHVLL